MISGFNCWTKLSTSLLRPCLTTKAPAATTVRRIAATTRSANGQTRIAGMPQEEVDANKVEAVRTRLGIWDVRNISEQPPALPLHVSN